MLLDDIRGQTAALTALRRALGQDRLAHAYIFSGPAGVGKRCAAVGLAHALLCESVPGRGCGSCAACTTVRAGSHPDYHFTTTADGKQRLGVDQVRDMEQFLRLRPLRGGKKIAVVDPAQRLTPAAQSALLKVVEEPPGDAVLILVSTSAANLARPLVSRCQQLRFARLPVAEVEAVLRARPGPAADAADLLARYSRGSLGRASSLDPDRLREERQRVIEGCAVLRGASFSSLSEFAEWLVADRRAAAGKPAGDGSDREGRLDLVLGWYEEALAYRLRGAPAVVRYRDCLDALDQAVLRLSVPRALHDLRLVFDTLAALDRNANPRLAVETMLLQLAGTC